MLRAKKQLPESCKKEKQTYRHKGHFQISFTLSIFTGSIYLKQQIVIFNS